jgi:uncharacterized protein (DUF1684 family)
MDDDNEMNAGNSVKTIRLGFVPPDALAEIYDRLVVIAFAARATVGLAETGSPVRQAAEVTSAAIEKLAIVVRDLLPPPT